MRIGVDQVCPTVLDYEWYKERGFEAQLPRLDNKMSKLMIQAIKGNNQDCQLASPSDHRTNPVERAIEEMRFMAQWNALADGK